MTLRTALALALGVSSISCSSGTPIVNPTDRSWSSLKITVVPKGAEEGVDVRAQWLDSSDGLWIRYVMCLTQSGSGDMLLLPSADRLARFQKWGTGIGKYSEMPVFLRQIDQKKPYRVVFDYEIWKGQPSKGELLAKNSVFSPEIGPQASQ